MLLIIFGIYYLSFYPGGVFVDTWVSYNMLEGNEEFSAHHPVGYTLLLNIVKLFDPNLITGFGVFSFIQVLSMVVILTYFVYWLLNRRVNPIIVTGIVLFLGFFKLYPLYSISIWKDTPFSLILFLFILCITDLLDDFKNKNIKIKNIIKFNIYGFLTIFFRSNGKFIIFASIIILFFTYIKGFKKECYVKNIKKFYIISMCMIILSFIIESLYPIFGIKKTEFVESLAIPIQQIARVVVVDGNITEEQKELIEKVLPSEDIKSRYSAMIVDKIKWSTKFNSEYLSEHKSQYFKLWLELLIQNPGEYVKAFLLETSGYWTFNVKGEEAYISATTWKNLEGIIPNQDLISQKLNISFSEDLLKVSYYSGGFFFWITVLSMLISFRIGNKRYLIAYLPSMVLWGTVMIATPMAQALRYVYILVLMLPLNLVYPAMICTEKIKDEQIIDN